MGASREGIMSVRDRINLVLQETRLSEDNDPVRVGNDAKSVPTTTDNNTLESRAADQNVLLSKIPPGGGSLTTEGGEEVDVIEREDSLTITSDTSHDVKAESVEKFSLIVLRQLLRQQLGVINTLGEKLKTHGDKFEAVNKEKNELHTKLEREREEQASLLRDNAKLLEEKIKADKLILEQIEKIQELEQQLAKVTAPKAVEERSTCMTPAPPPPQQMPNQLRVDNDDRLFATPTPPASRRAITDLRSLYASQAQRSDSPPQLSPACTPRSLPQNVYPSGGSRGLGRFLRGDDDDSDDEFEEELQCLTNPMDQEANEPNSPLSFRPQKSSAFHVSHQSRRVHSAQFVSNSAPESRKRRRLELSPCPYSDSAPPNKRECINNQRPSLFARPFPRPRNSRLMFADNRRRYFINNSLGRNRFVGSHFRQSMNSLGLPKNNLGDNGNSRSISSQSTSTRPPPQLIGIRNNNFLNVARPIPKKCAPSASKNSTATGPVNHSPHFVGSLEYDDTEGSRRDETLPELDTVNHSVKRGTDTCLSKHKFRLSGQSSSPKVSTVRSLQSSLPNGIVEQKFSQRGRLLKPNRARYSPDPDISVNPREKCITTKKSYFVPEPPVQEGYRDEASGKMGAASTTGEGEVDEEENEPVCTTGDSAVEVPKWRIISFEGFKDDAERIPPDDDMSEEAFHKRHQKLEAKEKQRKRWDSQRMREESYRERLKRKQEERERQKELRRQRKRKGRTGCTSDEEQESLLPRLEDIKAIYVNKKLPVGTYGFTLPLVEKVDFQLLWRPKPVSIRVDCESSRKDDDGNSNQQQLSSSSVSRILQRSPSPPSTSDSRPLPSSTTTCLLPSPTSLEISNLPLSLENIPPENANNSDSSSSNPTSSMLSSGSSDPKVINVDLTFENESDNPRATATEAFDVTTTTITIAEEGEVDSTSSSPIFTINLTDFDTEDNECTVADSNSSVIDQVNCIRRSPSPVPEEESSYEPASSSSEAIPCESTKSFTKLPPASSSSSPKPSSIVTPVSTASITFLIPSNPLAPRHSHPPINTITSPSHKGRKVCSSSRPARTSSLSEDYRGKDGSFGS